MKKYFTSNKANAILHSIKDYNVNNRTRRCAEDIVSVMQDSQSADMLIALEIAIAITRKTLRDERIAKRIGALEDSANYWIRRSEEKDTIIDLQREKIELLDRQLAETLKKKEAELDATLEAIGAHIELHTTGTVPVEDDEIDLDEDNDDVLIVDTDGILLIEGSEYYVGKTDGTRLDDGNMSVRVKIVGVKGKDAFGYYAEDDGSVSDQIVHFDDAPGRYDFCRIGD